MNSFSKVSKQTFWRIVAVLIVGLVVSPASAINVNAIYTAACQRDIGVIVRVDDHLVHFLTTAGKVKQIRPHEIIYLAYYPMDRFPVTSTVDLSSVKKVNIITESNNRLVRLVSGWPIGFSQDKVSFLSTRGSETVINRRNIFGVEILPTERETRFKYRARPDKFSFVHPYVFRGCPQESKLKARPTKVYPQQVLSHPVMIKRELDALREGYAKIRRYEREQDFYAVPEVFKNETALGLWQSINSRYGSSNKRTSNLVPVLTDSYSSDVFDYQHTFVTGAAPLPYGIHEEPQSQAYYAFKASYFHLSAMVDPSTVLVGKNYEWVKSDFDKPDDRINDIGLIEMGLDFGPITLQLYVMNRLNLGINYEDEFFQEIVGLGRVGLSYQNHLFKAELNGGARSFDDNDLSRGSKSLDLTFVRLNFVSYFLRDWDVSYSFILRSLEYEGAFVYQSESLTNALYGTYHLNKRYRIGGYAAVEKHSNEFGLTQLTESKDSMYLKGGAFLSLSF